MVGPLLPAFFGAASSLLPMASSLLSATTQGSAGVAHIVEKKLRSWEDKEFAMRERVRSRMHLVFVLRPCVDASASAEPPQPALMQPSSYWSSWFRGSGDNKCEIAGYTITCPPEPPTVSPLSLGEGAERHEMVLCKSQGYICVDYKGMLYRMIDEKGGVMPGGLKAIRLNVLYDLLRSAAQSGEFSVGQAAPKPPAPQPDLLPPDAALPPSPAASDPTPLTPGAQQRGTHTMAMSAAELSPSPPSFLAANTGGLSEAMGAWSKLRMRAEMHCMRGDAVMFATYSDTEFTRDQMMKGVDLHAMGKDDADNPYCAFVTKKMNALVAQGEILGVADLHSATATSSAMPEEESTDTSAPHAKSMAECYKSFSRIRDITELSSQFSNSVMPWLGKLSAISSPTAENKTTPPARK